MKTYANFLTEGKNKAVNLKDAKWKGAHGGQKGFVGQKAYGVLNNKGQALSSDGVAPATYASMEVAKEIAVYADDFKGHTWINIK